MQTLGKDGRLRHIFLDGWYPYLWISLAILLVYSRTAFFSFTYLDDKDLIADNFGFISNLSNIPAAFVSRVFPKLLAPYYRPLLTVSLMLNAKFAGASPAAYHITNIALHAAAACLVFRLLSRLGFGRLPSLFLSTVFAVHPVLVQAVAWIPGRNDSLLAIFTIASFTSFLDYVDRHRRSDYILHIAFFALALFTKETAVMLTVLCVLYVTLTGRKGISKDDIKSVVLGWAVASGCWVILRSLALRGVFESSADGLSQALWVSLPAVVQYIGKIFFPFNLSVFPTIRDTAFIYGIGACILIAVILSRPDKNRGALIAFGLLWFTLFLAPSLLRPSAAFVHDFQEHRLYLPMVGMIIALSGAGLVAGISGRVSSVIACLAIITILSAVNIRHSGNFMDRLSFWENAVATSPHSPITRLNAASAFFDAGMIDRAEEEYSAVAALDRVSSPAYAGLGHVYMARGMPDAAELQFKKAVAAYRANYPAYVSLGTLYYRRGELSKAAAMWLEALKYDPGNKDALRNMAILCAEQKDYKAARFYVDRMRIFGIEPPGEFVDKLGT